jgi:hypothetical protein
MARSANAVLSPSELNALRRVANGLAQHLPPIHKDLLISMGLIVVNLSGRLVLTEAGRQRLIATDARDGRVSRLPTVPELTTAQGGPPSRAA